MDLNYKGVVESVVENLRVYITMGEMPPGKKLNEIELSKRLEISRPPLREAFRILENEGLIISVPRKGSFVASVSLRDFREILEIREMMECWCIELLHAKGIKHFPEVDSALAASDGLTVPDTSDPYVRFEFIKKIGQFHIKLVESAGNSRLTRGYNSLFTNLARYQAMYIFTTGHRSQRDHEQILDLIKKGNYEEAKKSMKSHIYLVTELMEERLGKKEVGLGAPPSDLGAKFKALTVEMRGETK